jgi:alkylation response protein AidB-like acyl-CoA dehydrogenase
MGVASGIGTPSQRLERTSENRYSRAWLGYGGPMQPTYSDAAETYREKIQGFIAEHMPANWEGIGSLTGDAKKQFLSEWRQVLADNSLLATMWSAEYGGPGLSANENVIIAEEFTKAGLPTGGSNDGFGIGMVGNTIIEWGTEEQKKHYLPRILSGEDLWCQGYSEPDAGSDLANLGCKAELDGDEWIVNGQKIWTSSGQSADWIFVLARTDADAPKHQGITFLLCPMDQPGVEVRPIVNIAGHSHFNEVFFSEARVPKANVIGAANGGWAVAMTLLGYERGFGATTTYFRYRAELDRLIEMARKRGALDDPNIRQRVAWCHSKVEIMRWLGQQVLTGFLNGEPPGPKSSIGKLNWSEYHRAVTELALDVMGADAMILDGDPGYAAGLGAADAGTPNTSSAWINSFMVARAGTIYAGTSQVQRNIVGERVLGLPKEPRADEGPWNTTQR